MCKLPNVISAGPALMTGENESDDAGKSPRVGNSGLDSRNKHTILGLLYFVSATLTTEFEDGKCQMLKKVYSAQSPVYKNKTDCIMVHFVELLLEYKLSAKDHRLDFGTYPDPRDLDL